MSLAKNYDADGAIGAYTIVKFGSADGHVAAAAAATDGIIGVTTDAGADAAGNPVDVIHDGIAFVKLGGTVTRGDWITSDASGHGVKANPAAGANNFVVGRALQSGVSGDVINVLVDPDQIQG